MDTGDGILGTNMYVYCRNNPVNRYDPSGMADLGFSALGEALAIVAKIADISLSISKATGVPFETVFKYSVGVAEFALQRFDAVWETLGFDVGVPLLLGIVEAGAKYTYQRGSQSIFEIVSKSLQPAIYAMRTVPTNKLAAFAAKMGGKTGSRAIPIFGDIIGLGIDVYGDIKDSGGFHVSTFKSSDFWKRAGISGGAFALGLGTEFIPGLGTAASIAIGLGIGIVEDAIKFVVVG
jgi:hypothetical protein